MWSTEINESTKDHLKHSTLFSMSTGCGHMAVLSSKRFWGCNTSLTLTRSGQEECFLTVTLGDILTLIICSSKTGTLLQKNSNREVIFCECIVKVIFFAVNLPSQITLLSLRISYVFSSLSPLNLPLSCPEPFVANRARRSEVFKVDVWVGNGANLNVAYGSLPSAFCSPQACGACQLSLVSSSHKADAHMLPASYSTLRKSARNRTAEMHMRWSSWADEHHHIWLMTDGANDKCKVQN